MKKNSIWETILRIVIAAATAAVTALTTTSCIAHRPLTDKNLKLTEIITASYGINLDKIEIGSDYGEAFSSIKLAIETIDVRLCKCIFDITTVPRIYIFPIIRTLEKHLGSFYYIYNDPASYDDAPFLKEFTTPSPIIGASGIPDLDKKLCQ